MFDGLKIVSLPGGYYGRSINVVGWLKRVAGGDEWALYGACSIVRTGAPDFGAMARIATDGPGRTHKIGKPAESVEHIHRLVLRRAIACDEAAWAKHCPKPADWNVDR